MLVTTPFVRPFRWSRLILTYLLPILPLLCLWDGIVSCLRTYSPRELRQLVRDLESDDYRWEVGEFRFAGTPLSVPYLLGWPGAAYGVRSGSQEAVRAPRSQRQKPTA